MAQSARVDGKITDPGAVGQAVELNVSGFSRAGFQISGTFTATVHFKASVDGVNFTDLAVATIADFTTVVTTAAADGVWVSFGAFAFTAVQVICSAYTSGTIVVSIIAAS